MISYTYIYIYIYIYTHTHTHTHTHTQDTYTHTHTHKVLGPVLMTIPASKLAVIVMHELMSSFLAHGGYTAHTNASKRVGRAVQTEWGMDALKVYILGR